MILLLAACALIGVALDGVEAPAARTPVFASSVGMPAAAPPSALSSSWFCAGATDGGSHYIPGVVVIANAGREAATAAVTLLGSNGARAHRTLSVAARATVQVPESVPGGAPWVGAFVDVDAGQVAVAQQILTNASSSGSGSQGAPEVTPCATSASPRWYFPSGQTLINAGVELTLVNPQAEAAIVDLSFTTSEGQEAPQGFQGLVVPARGLLAVDLASHLRRRAAIATTVSVRAGAAVAFETDWVDPPAPGAVLEGTPQASQADADPAFPVAGVEVTLGAPSPQTSWIWPAGVAGPGLSETYVIYNPAAKAAQVRLSIGLDQGQAEPFPLSVGPYQVLTVNSEGQARIPPGVGHFAALESLNGVGVVALRSLVADGSSAWYPQSGPSYGRAAMLGEDFRARRWLLPMVGTAGLGAAELVVYNPGPKAAKVALAGLDEAALTANGIPSPVSVGPGRRAVLGLAGSEALGHPLLVSSDVPVYVELDSAARAPAHGISTAPAVPLLEGS